MSGYIKQTTVAGLETEQASHSNLEFDALSAAMSSSGHNHDGSPGEGPVLSQVSNKEGNVVADDVGLTVEDTLVYDGATVVADVSLESPIDLVDSLGNQVTLDAVNVKSTLEANEGFEEFSSVLKTKLDGIEEGATGNPTKWKLKELVENSGDVCFASDRMVAFLDKTISKNAIVEWSEPSVSFPEEATIAPLVIQRSGTLLGDRTVRVVTRDGLAKDGVNYNALNYVVTLPEGQNEVLVNVPLIPTSLTSSRSFSVEIHSEGPNVSVASSVTQVFLQQSSESNEAEVAALSSNVQDLQTSVDTTIANYTAAHAEYDARIAAGEELTDVLIVKDPQSGVITNKAFEYTDNSYSSASTRIDGVEAEVTLNAQAIAATDTTVTEHSATLTLHESSINQKATYSEVDASIANAISAITPAYSWQFNTNVDSWTGVTWDSEGFVNTTGNSSISGLTFAADDNPVVRVSARTTDKTSSYILLSWNSGTQKIAFPLISSNNTWHTLALDLGPSDGWTGNITDILLESSSLDIDSVVIGKRSASEQDLANLTARMVTAETELDAENARWGAYVTTAYWDTNALTNTDVQSEINAWDATHNITATFQEMATDQTITKANSAQQWIDASSANIRAEVSAWWTEGEESNLRTAETKVDALEGEIISTVSSVSGVNKDLEKTGAEQVLLASQQFFDAHNFLENKTAIATANTELSAVTEEQQAHAQQLTTLDAANSSAVSQLAAHSQALVDQDAAIVSQGTTLNAKITDVETESKVYSRSLINQWTNSNGDIVDAPLDPENPPAGYTFNEGPLVEDVRKLKVTTGSGGQASIEDISTVFQSKDGKLVARGGMLLNNNGRVSGVVAHDDGSTSNLDLLGENVRIGYEEPDGTYVPLFDFDTVNKKLRITGQLTLTDGHEVNSITDIRALDGVNGQTIYQVYQHSINGISGWHSDMQTNDYYQRKATVTDGVQGAWGDAYQIRGNDGTPGTDGYIPQKGVDYFDGSDGSDGKHGNFISFIFRTGVTRPSTPSGGSFDGTNEVIPNGCYDDPLFEDGKITWVSKRTYSYSNGSWTGSAWSMFSEFVKKGDVGATGTKGTDGTDGTDGNDGAHGNTHIHIEGYNGVFPSSATAISNFEVKAQRDIQAGDILTYYKLDAQSNPTASDTRMWNGTVWETFVSVVHGNQLVQGTVIADDIRANRTIEAPVINGGVLQGGSIVIGPEFGLANFTVNSDGDLTAVDSLMHNLRAIGGTFTNLTIDETCDVRGSVYAEKIVGDITNSYLLQAPNNGVFFYQGLSNPGDGSLPLTRCLRLVVPASPFNRIGRLSNLFIGAIPSSQGGSASYTGRMEQRRANGTVLQSKTFSQSNVVIYSSEGETSIYDWNNTGDATPDYFEIPAGDTVVEFWLGLVVETHVSDIAFVCRTLDYGATSAVFPHKMTLELHTEGTSVGATVTQ